jgi:hypothetical protein
VQLPQVHHGFRQLALRTARQEVPTENAARSNRTADVGGFDDTLIDEPLSIMDDGYRDPLRLLIGQVTRLGQNHDPLRGAGDLRRVGIGRIESGNLQDGAAVDNVALVERIVDGRHLIDHDRYSTGI